MPAHVEQMYTGCLAQAAYVVASAGEAAVIDPLRDPKPYLDYAAEHGLRIRYVIETHFHADFFSGHQDLAKATTFVAHSAELGQPLGLTVCTRSNSYGCNIGSRTVCVVNSKTRTSMCPLVLVLV
jgi:hydroxyacylglutathione hydrolase